LGILSDKYISPDEQVRKRNLSAWAFIPIRCSATAPVSLGPVHVETCGTLDTLSRFSHIYIFYILILAKLFLGVNLS